MKLQQLIQSIRKRVVAPRVYALELDCGMFSYLNICIAYSLEEAMALTLKNIANDPKTKEHAGATWQIKKYVYQDIQKLIDEATTMTVAGSDRVENLDKNQLMTKIIDEKNVDLYHENITIFTDYEKQMLHDKLTTPSNDSAQKIKVKKLLD